MVRVGFEVARPQSLHYKVEVWEFSQNAASARSFKLWEKEQQETLAIFHLSPSVRPSSLFLQTSSARSGFGIRFSLGIVNNNIAPLFL